MSVPVLAAHMCAILYFVLPSGNGQAMLSIPEPRAPLMAAPDGADEGSDSEL